jgi:hypothetical protein
MFAIRNISKGYWIGTVLLVASIGANAQNPATTQLRQVSEADLNNTKAQLAKSGCASFDDALHMIESDSEATRNRGSACLNSLNELAQLRRYVASRLSDQAAK